MGRVQLNADTFIQSLLSKQALGDVKNLQVTIANLKSLQANGIISLSNH